VDALFVDSLDSAMLPNMTIVDWKGHDKYFGASLAGRPCEAAYYRAV
jgi:hypothetical protein